MKTHLHTTSHRVVGASLLLLLSCLRLSAQQPRFESLTIADGLSQGMIYDILQDRDGFLWFATKDGLNRYDGYRFEVFTNNPFDPFSISGNDLHALFEDSRGNLWMSVGGRAVDVLERGSGKFLHITGQEWSGSLYAGASFAETPDGSIWIGAPNGLLRFRWKNADASVQPRSPDLEAYATVEIMSQGSKPGKSFFQSLTAQADGTLLVSILDDAIYKFNPAGKTLTPAFTELGDASLFGTTPGRLWMNTKKGIYLIENDAPRLISFGDKTPNNAFFLFPDGNGNLIWACSPDLKSSFYSSPEAEILRTGSVGQPSLVFQLDRYSPSSFIDRSGNLWIGTSGYGLRKTHLARQPFQHLLQGVSVMRIFAGQKTYVFPHTDTGFGRLADIKNEAAEALEFSSGLEVIGLFYAKNGASYFIATDLKDYYLCIGKDFGERHKIERMDAYSIPFFEDSQGVVWIGGLPARLACYRPSEKKLTYLDLPKQIGEGATVTAIHADARQNLWIGTMKGIVRFRISDFGFRISGDAATKSEIRNPKSEIFQTDPSNLRSLRHNYVTSFAEDPLDPDRYLWVSTKGGGLNLLDKNTGDIQHFTSQNSGLPNDVVYGILPGASPARGKGGELWMSTNRGLSRLIVDSDRVYRFRNFREFDGLQSDEFNTGAFARNPEGRLFFGGVNGLTVFDPSEIVERTSDAAVLITGLKINNLYVHHRGPGSVLRQPVHLVQSITLQHTQNLVTLEFALMDFTNPQENRFRYRLQGVDPNWVEAGTSHTANYAQLRPGSYTFEVQGSIGGGVWNEKTARLKITVLPPWWATWWAYGLYVLAFGGTLYLFYKMRLRQKLEHQEALRLQELDTFKSRFFTNITHEFRTPLTVILGTSEQLAVGSEQWAVSSERPAVKGKLSLIKRNGESLLRLINQILDLAKLESNSLKINYVQGDVLPYLRYIAESLHSLANAQNVMLRVESDQAKIEMDYDPERLLQIVHNLISNAIKFTPSGGRVTLFVRLNPSSAAAELGFGGTLALTVSDTGAGIPTEDLPKIFDRFYQANNLEKAKAGGTGIGLSLTRELVKALGGEISVESEVGKGTTFSVVLPVTRTAPPLTPPLTPKGEPQLQNPAEIFETPASEISDLGSPLGVRGGVRGGSKPLLLLIEDNPDVVEYLAACLGENYQLDFAYNGKAGIEKALETVPDLILSDVMMPEKDGFEVCDFLKNDERTSHIPIVLLTAKADVESRIAGLKRGADAYLAKPFHQEELAVTLANLLEMRRKLQAKYSDFGFGISDFGGVAGNSEIPNPKSEIEAAGTVDLENQFLKKLRLIIEENLSNTDLDGELICRKIGMSRSNLHAKLSALTGMPISHFVRGLRLRRAKELLGTTAMNVSEVAYEVGFDNPKYFTRLFSEEFGRPPSEFRKPTAGN